MPWLLMTRIPLIIAVAWPWASSSPSSFFSAGRAPQLAPLPPSLPDTLLSHARASPSAPSRNPPAYARRLATRSKKMWLRMHHQTSPPPAKLTLEMMTHHSNQKGPPHLVHVIDGGKTGSSHCVGGRWWVCWVGVACGVLEFGKYTVVSSQGREVWQEI